MKDSVIKLKSKLIRILGKVAMVGGGGFLIMSILGLIMSVFSEDSAPVGSLILLGVVGLAGILLGRWLVKEHHQLSERLWAYGERTPYSGIRLLMKVETVAKAQKLKTVQRQPLIDGLAVRSGGHEIKVVAQGGAGWEHLSGKSLFLSLSSDSLYLTDLEGINEHSIAFNRITDVNIGGPGTVTKGGGAIGGGFGVEGFLVGAATASLINLLTTHTTTKTLVQIGTKGAELFLLVSTHDPDGMRRYLSPVFAQLSLVEQALPNKITVVSVADELSKLNELRRAGTINDDEYVLLKGRLLQ
ncbi:hypothetical protein AN403_5077 [Pseudomonas fluorescens]|uniref:Uncharacterized protein n=1 Tax=Pseudomonas fluorescens TaxID=294 RepID=A0A0P9BD96_PSEFL|nr:hypothetical protein [Pseudomonas fluorescens]KPU60979.1 hypothetical protein AN403_5077 [Pseudomonas fluorescens]